MCTEFPNDGDPGGLRVEVFLSEQNTTVFDGLTPYRVLPSRRTFPADAPRLSHDPDGTIAGIADATKSHVVVLDTTAIDPSDCARWIAYFTQQKIGVVLLTQPNDLGQLSLLQAGAHGIFTVDTPADQVAFILWSAHEQAKQLGKLDERVRELETKLVQQKVIGQAKSLVAAQLQISESAALKHLRKEARQRRRTIYELAAVILEAQGILGQNGTPPSN